MIIQKLPDGHKCVSDLETSIFCKVKEIKYLSGGVAVYAAQTNVLIDTEIAKKDRFQTETKLKSQTGCNHDFK